MGRAMLAVITAGLWPAVAAHCEDCVGDRERIHVTDSFFYSASSDQGAVGDVVAVELSLTVDDLEVSLDGTQPDLFGFTLTGCYDGRGLELVDSIAYSEHFDRVAFLSSFFSQGGHATPSEGDTLGVFTLFGGTQKENAPRYLIPGEGFPLATLYFRVRGQVTGDYYVRFCDDVLISRDCGANRLSYSTAVPTIRTFELRSTRHVPAVIRVLPGEPTRPEPPPLPPNAKVYPEPPTADTANIRFELVGPGVTHPGATDVPFELFVTSRLEFSGFMTSLTFPAPYLELSHVEEPTRPGVMAIDNAGGGFGLILANSRARLGAEEERVRLATLHFNVKEEAREATALVLRFAPHGNYFNWLAIRHAAGLNPDALPITAEVTPIVVTEAILRVHEDLASAGDVNRDDRLDLSDAVALLGHLFLGTQAACLAAGDFNADGRIDIADPVSILNHLFQGRPRAPGAVDCLGE